MPPEPLNPLAPGLVFGRGARATEALLIDEVDRLCAEGRADVSLLAKPIRVVVPSQSLREHVSTRLVGGAGRPKALAGVQVQTLNSLALDVLAELPASGERADALLPILVRQCARDESALTRVLDPLDDAWGPVVSAVRDLIDAGFEPGAHAEALDECVSEEALPRDTRERARAVIRTAGSVVRRLEALERWSSGGRLASAARRLQEDPARLPTRALLIHGFADATGVASDLIEVLVQQLGATLLVDVPPDPTDPERIESGAVFVDRLVRRLAGPAAPAPMASGIPPARLELVRASGAGAEVRATAERIRDLLDAGTEPEAIGVVSRSLQLYRSPIRTQLGRLGIPFSGIGGSAPASGVERRLSAFVDIVAEGSDVAADRWVDARDVDRRLRMDLRIAFHVLGAARLRDAAGLDLETPLAGRDHLVLPVGRGIEVDAEGDSDDEEQPVAARLRKRSVSASDLKEAVRAALATSDVLETWPDPGPFAAHARALRGLMHDRLAWHPDAPTSRAILAGLAELETEIPADFELGRDDLVALLRPMLAEMVAGPLGGMGSGVQVLSVTAARARTFEHLFVLGLNRDVFPRPVTDDPLLPDGLRRRLEILLPEIPIQRRGLDEERYLFAQLVSASPAVTLSWQAVDEEGRARTPSPLVEPLRLAQKGDPHEARSLAAQPSALERPRPAHEAALLEGLYGSRAGFESALEAAVRERAFRSDSRVDAARLASGRNRVILELNRDRGAHGPGPYLGFVGASHSAGDPRNRRLFVTRLEAMCRCPWQSFVERVLEVEAPPDALESLPTVTPLLKGSVVHDALESIVLASLDLQDDPLAEVLDRDPVSVPIPSDEVIETHLRTAARNALRDAGISLPGFDKLLVAAAGPLVRAARDLAWPGPGSGSGVLGVEVWGELEVQDGQGKPRPLGFRADRVDRGPDGVRLLDYKSGKPFSDGKKPETRRAHLRGGIASGSLLQAAAYALGAGGSGAYVYLRDRDAPGAEGGLGLDDGDLLDVFRLRVAQALDAIQSGAFFPRLVDAEGKVHRACKGCSVASACVQGDSTARRRLQSWLSGGSGSSDAERALRALWEDAP